MALLKAGTSILDVNTEDNPGNAVGWTTYNPAGCYEHIRLDTFGSAYLYDETKSEIWVQFFHGWNSNGGLTDAPYFIIKDKANGRELFQIRNGTLTGSTTSNAQVWYNNAGTWTALGDLFEVINFRSPKQFDVYLKLDAVDGVFRVYYEKALVAELTGNTILNTSTQFDRIEVRSKSSSSTAEAHFGAFIIADEDTRGMRYLQENITGNGGLQEITGGFANVNGPGEQTASSIVSSGPGDRSTFTTAAYNTSFTDGREVLAVTVSGHSRKDAAGSAKIRPIVRSGTAVGAGADVVLEDAHKSYSGIFPLNPDTGLAWTISEMNSAQGGVEHRAA